MSAKDPLDSALRALPAPALETSGTVRARWPVPRPRWP